MLSVVLIGWWQLPPSPAVSPKDSYRVFHNYIKLCQIVDDSVSDLEILSTSQQGQENLKLYHHISAESLQIPPNAKPIFERAYEKHELRYYTQRTQAPSDLTVETELKRITAAEDTVQAAEAKVRVFLWFHELSGSVVQLEELGNPCFDQCKDHRGQQRPQVPVLAMLN